jgi:casein kinase II subunit beta
MCAGQALLPMGQHDTPNVSAVKLYCARCEDLYNPKSTRHASIDGAYFGTSFHNILFQVYPNMIPPKSIRRYEPKVFGFRVHSAAALMRWHDDRRDLMVQELRKVGVDASFVEDEEFSEEITDEEDEEEGLEDGAPVPGSQMQT